MSYDDYDWDQLVATYRPVRVWNYGKASYDQTHNFVFNYIWDLPKLSKGLKNPIVHQVLDNWQLAGFSAFVSGVPLGVGYTLVDGADITGGGDGGRIVSPAKPSLTRATAASTAGSIPRYSPGPPRATTAMRPRTCSADRASTTGTSRLFKKFPARSEARFLRFAGRCTTRSTTPSLPPSTTRPVSTRRETR